MGNFYTNYTLRGASPQAVATVLSGRTAIVTPEHNGTVVVFDEESDSQDPDVITQLGAHLSSRLRCPVLAVLNHDDDVLFYQLFDGGSLADEYCSAPGYFSGDDASISGGDAQKLCSAFGASSAEAVSLILHPPEDSDGYTFAFEQHKALVRALNISDYSIGAGFNYISEGELPGDLTEDSLLRIP